jgi:hypothetical protein
LFAQRGIGTFTPYDAGAFHLEKLGISVAITEIYEDVVLAQEQAGDFSQA